MDLVPQVRPLASLSGSHGILILLAPLSGYDFGYLLKIVSCAPLPATETEFFELLRIWFPCIWDIKVSGPLALCRGKRAGRGLNSLGAQYLMKSCKTLKGGLQEVADDLGVRTLSPEGPARSSLSLLPMTGLSDRTATSSRLRQPADLGNILQDAGQVLREQDRQEVHGTHAAG